MKLLLKLKNKFLLIYTQTMIFKLHGTYIHLKQLSTVIFKAIFFNSEIKSIPDLFWHVSFKILVNKSYINLQQILVFNYKYCLQSILPIKIELNLGSKYEINSCFKKASSHKGDFRVLFLKITTVNDNVSYLMFLCV